MEHNAAGFLRLPRVKAMGNAEIIPTDWRNAEWRTKPVGTLIAGSRNRRGRSGDRLFFNPKGFLREELCPFAAALGVCGDGYELEWRVDLAGLPMAGTQFQHLSADCSERVSEQSARWIARDAGVARFACLAAHPIRPEGVKQTMTGVIFSGKSTQALRARLK